MNAVSNVVVPPNDFGVTQLRSISRCFQSKLSISPFLCVHHQLQLLFNLLLFRPFSSIIPSLLQILHQASKLASTQVASLFFLPLMVIPPSLSSAVEPAYKGQVSICMHWEEKGEHESYFPFRNDYERSGTAGRLNDWLARLDRRPVQTFFYCPFSFFSYSFCCSTFRFFEIYPTVYQQQC